jgi:predicted NBD/HSP70 family sugar kinase
MRRPRSGSLGSLRQRNRLRVLEAIRGRDAVSRAGIARETGLAPSTVSNLVGELQREGLVVERDDRPAAAQGGRPPVMLTLDPRAGAVLGLHFDHSVLRVALGDLGHTILAEAHREVDVDRDAAAGLDAAAALVDEVLDEAGVEHERVLGAGVALAAPMESDGVTVGSSTIMPGWVGLDVAGELERRLGLSVHVENDANLGALAESILGAGRGASEMAYVMLSGGIGCGLILHGRLYRGAGGTAGEIGHVLVDEHGRLCRCGNRGCLETFAGAHALLELLDRDGTTVDGLVELATGGDPACRRLVADAGRVVGGAVAALCNQFNPGRVVVGGELAATGDLLLGPIRDGVERFAIPAAARRVEIVAGALGDRAELLGALVLVVGRSDQVLSGRVRAAVGSADR